MLKRITEEMEYSEATMDQIHHQIQVLNERMDKLNQFVKEGRYHGAYGLLHSMQHRAGVLKTTFRTEGNYP